MACWGGYRESRGLWFAEKNEGLSYYNSEQGLLCTVKTMFSSDEGKYQLIDKQIEL